MGGEFDTALMIDGRPFALVWPDEEGSVGQHLIRSAVVDLREEFQAARPLLDRGLNEDAGVIAAAGPFLGVVAPGSYRVRFEPQVDNWFGFHQLEAGSSRATKCENFYPASCELVATLPQEHLDRDRVEHFRKAIETGERPVVVALAADEAWVGFVIDGHHKLTAYHELRVPPALLSLVRQAPKVVEELVHTEFGQHSMWADYAGKRSSWFGPKATCGVPLRIFVELEAAAVTLAKRLEKDVPHPAVLRAALVRALSEKSGYYGFLEGIITEEETVSLICAHLFDALGVAEQGGQGGEPFDRMAEVLLKAVRRWGKDGQVTPRATKRPSEAWYLLDFGEGPPGSLVVPVRWRGDENTERPTLLPYRAGAREFTTATGDALTAEVESLRIAEAKRLMGVWTDAPDLEIDGHDGNIIISWRPAQPTTANIALLRKSHHPFSEIPLAELRNRMKRGPQFSFHAEFHYHGDEREFIKKLEEGGMDAVMTATSSWEMAWPPAHVVVELYADMWAKPHRFVLEEREEDGEPCILHAETGHFVLIEEGADLLRALNQRMREEGVPVRKRTR